MTNTQEPCCVIAVAQEEDLSLVVRLKSCRGESFDSLMSAGALQQKLQSIDSVEYLSSKIIKIKLTESLDQEQIACLGRYVAEHLLLKPGEFHIRIHSLGSQRANRLVAQANRLVAV